MNPFIASIVNALPEAIVTAIITGIFVYLIQKRIESSYNEKLETFKAQLQSSYFEHQTKFVRNHQKEVETLETLYQKFLVFSDGFSKGILGSIDYKLSSKKITKIEYSDFKNYPYQKNTDDLQECINYFNHNSLYLSDDIRYKTERILHYASLYLAVISLVLLGLKLNLVGADFFKSINDILAKCPDFAFSMLNANKPNTARLLHEMVQQMYLYQSTIRDMYQSVADISTTN